jgi:hypothetical protein
MQVARLEARARNGGSLRFRKLRCLVIGKQARVRRYWQKCQVFRLVSLNFSLVKKAVGFEALSVRMVNTGHCLGRL